MSSVATDLESGELVQLTDEVSTRSAVMQNFKLGRWLAPLALLAAVTFGPVLVNWSVMLPRDAVLQDQEGWMSFHQGTPYLAATLNLAKCIIGAVAMAALTAFQGTDQLQAMFSWTTIMKFLLPSFFTSLGDLFELLANQQASASLYSVVLQSRLLCTAVISYFLLGKRQTKLQVSILVSLTLLTGAFFLAPDQASSGGVLGSQANSVSIFLGVACTLVKAAASGFCAVTTQQVASDPEVNHVGFAAILGSTFLSGIFFSAITLVPYFTVFHWEHGFFGGEAVTVWHCHLGEAEAMCHTRAPFAIIEQGWSLRTVAVVWFYIFLDYARNAVTVLFGAMMNSLIGASSVTSVHLVALGLWGQPFDFLKFILAVLVAMQSVQYIKASQRTLEESENTRASYQLANTVCKVGERSRSKHRLRYGKVQEYIFDPEESLDSSRPGSSDFGARDVCAAQHSITDEASPMFSVFRSKTWAGA